MLELKNDGKYSISKEEKKVLDDEFFASYCDEQECSETIKDFFDEYGYVLDTHTAVAINVSQCYKDFSKSDVPTVVLSTASPYKFAHDVLKSICGKAPEEAFKCANILFEQTATPIPEQILLLKDKEKRFSKVIDRDGTLEAVTEFIKK